MNKGELEAAKRWGACGSAPVLHSALSVLLLTIMVWLPLGRAQDAAPVQASRTDIINYMAYSESLASSGQPTPAQLEAQAAAGVQRVVYLAFADHDTSLLNEDRIVRSLGMQFVQVPVLWERPSVADFRAFAALMQEASERRTLVHCQVNWRASSFSFLYRVIFNDVPMDDAVMDLTSIWTPVEHWRRFIVEVLATYGMAPDCEFCDALRG